MKLGDVKCNEVHHVTQVTWEECKETCMDECSEQHFKELVTEIVEHWMSAVTVRVLYHFSDSRVGYSSSY